MLQLSPANPRILVQPLAIEETTESGLYLGKEILGIDLQLVKIISVSSDVIHSKNPMVQKDCYVGVNRHCGFEVKQGGLVYRLITQDDIMVYVELDDEMKEQLKPIPELEVPPEPPPPSNIITPQPSTIITP